MKKKLLFISSEFYPISNGTTTCIENIIPLIAEHIHVVVYCNRENIKDKNEEHIFKAIVKRPVSIFDNPIILKNKLINDINLLRVNKIFKEYSTFLVKSILYPLQLLGEKKGYLNKAAWETNIFSYIDLEEDISSFDFVLAVGGPFNNFKVAEQIKSVYPKVKIILLQFDLYAYNPTILLNDHSNNEFNSRLEEEKEWYRIADYVLVTKEMYNVIRNTELIRFDDKMYSMHTPNLTNIELKKPQNIFDSSASSNFNIVYTGMFYEDIRNPHFTLNLFKLLIEMDPNIKLHIIGTGCENIVDEFRCQFKNNIFVYGKKSKEFAINAMYSANMLLNISNSVNSQAPSKIVEYIGACKPIINIYSVDKDLCRDYLEKYQLSISIKENYSQLEKLAKKVYSFILQNKDEKYDYNEISRIFHEFTPRAYANVLLEKLND